MNDQQIVDTVSAGFDEMIDSLNITRKIQEQVVVTGRRGNMLMKRGATLREQARMKAMYNGDIDALRPPSLRLPTDKPNLSNGPKYDPSCQQKRDTVTGRFEAIKKFTAALAPIEEARMVAKASFDETKRKIQALSSKPDLRTFADDCRAPKKTPFDEGEAAAKEHIKEWLKALDKEPTGMIKNDDFVAWKEEPPIGFFNIAAVDPDLDSSGRKPKSDVEDPFQELIEPEK